MWRTQQIARPPHASLGDRPPCGEEAHTVTDFSHEERGQVMTSNLSRLLAGAGLLLVAVPAIVQAQQATVVSGRITSNLQAPLQGVSVSIPSLNLGGYTNAEGRFSFTVPAS